MKLLAQMIEMKNTIHEKRHPKTTSENGMVDIIQTRESIERRRRWCCRLHGTNCAFSTLNYYRHLFLQIVIFRFKLNEGTLGHLEHFPLGVLDDCLGNIIRKI